MDDLIIELQLKGESEVLGKFNRLEKAENSLTDNFRKANEQLIKVSGNYDNLSNKSIGLNSLIGNIGKTIGVAFSISKVIDFGKAVIDTTMRMQSLENSILFLSKTQEEYQRNMQFLRDTSSKLGLDLESITKGFKTIAGAAIPSGVTFSQTREIFLSVSKASAAMGLSAEETEGALLALGQMISKGNVQAEELRGQLGERLPGSFAIAAKAMGVTTGQLGKMLEQGEVVAKDFLPKFAKELEKTYSSGAVANAESLTANFNRFNAAVTNLMNTLGGILSPIVTRVIRDFTSLANAITSSISPMYQSTVAIEKEKDYLGYLVEAIRNTNNSSEVRKALIEELNAKYPEFVKKIDLTKASEVELKKALKETNKEYDQRIFLLASAEARERYSKKVLESIEREKKAILALDKLSKKSYNPANFIDQIDNYLGYTSQNIRYELKRQFKETEEREKYKQELEAELDALKIIAQRNGVEVEKIQKDAGEKIIKQDIELSEKQKKLFEKQAKENATLEARELEARQKQAIDLIQVKIDANKKTIEDETQTAQDRIEAVRANELLYDKLTKAQLADELTQYEVNENNKVVIKKITKTEKENIEASYLQKLIELTSEATAKIEKIRKEDLEKQRQEREAALDLAKTKAISEENTATFKQIRAAQQKVLDAENLSLAERKKIFTAFQKERQQIMLDNESRLLAIELQSLEDKKAILTPDRIKDIVQIEEQITKIKAQQEELRLKAFEKNINRELQLEQEKANKKRQIEQASLQLFNELSGLYFQSQKEKIDADLQNLQTQKQAELEAAGDNAEKKAYLNQKYAEKERILKQKQAQADKDKAIFDIFVQTSINVIRALGTPPVPNFLLAALMGSIGAVQVAAVSSRRIPKFRKGEEFLAEGVQGTDSDGLIIEAHKGERIVPAEINQYLAGIPNIALPRLLQRSEPSIQIDEQAIARAVAQGVKTAPFAKTVLDKDGFSAYMVYSHQTIKKLNADYEF